MNVEKTYEKFMSLHTEEKIYVPGIGNGLFKALLVELNKLGWDVRPPSATDALSVAQLELFGRFPDEIKLASLGHWSAARGTLIRCKKQLVVVDGRLVVRYGATDVTTDGGADMEIVHPVSFPLTEDDLLLTRVHFTIEEPRKGYLCEGGRQCDHGADGPHWVNE